MTIVTSKAVPTLFVFCYIPALLLAAPVAIDINTVPVHYFLFSIVRAFIIKVLEGCSLYFHNALRPINLLVMAISYTMDVGQQAE